MLKRGTVLQRDNAHRFEIITKDTNPDEDVVGFDVYVEMTTPQGVKSKIIFATTPEKAQKMLGTYKRDRGIK